MVEIIEGANQILLVFENYKEIEFIIAWLDDYLFKLSVLVEFAKNESFGCIGIQALNEKSSLFWNS
jgi:hypothetical protein